LTTCAAPAYLKRHGTPRKPEALVNHNCIRFVVPGTGRAQDWNFSATASASEYRYRGISRSIIAEALVEAALAAQR
jgi:DNA-binding transcriptional LysR family regulator